MVCWLFALFIVLCGVGHWLDVLTLWVPAYGIQGAEKAATAMASMTTCIILWMSLPKIASLPSADQLRESEMRFRGSFAAAHHGMAIVAIDGQILEVNGSPVRTPISTSFALHHITHGFAPNEDSSFYGRW